MVNPDALTPPTAEHKSYIVTAGGWARSGKGTSMAYLKGELEQADQQVVLIDQGIKFRAMAEVVMTAHEPLDSPTILNNYISSPEATKSTLDVLAEVASMDEATKKERLYTPELSKASGKIGKVPSAHKVAVGLLRSQVAAAVEAETDIVLIDGRSMEKYARQFDEQGLARFVMGWFFKCDPAIAARRSLGLFDDIESMPPEDKEHLLGETLGISDRNRSDTLRDVDPLREPMRAYHLDLPSYGLFGTDVPFKRAYEIVNRYGFAVVDTSYTNSIEEMTYPVTELTKFALMFRGPLQHEHVGIQTAKAD